MAGGKRKLPTADEADGNGGSVKQIKIENDEEDNHFTGTTEFSSPKQILNHSLSAGIFSNSILVVGESKRRFKVIREFLQMQSPTLARRLSVPDVVQEGLSIFILEDYEEESFSEFLQYVNSMDEGWSGEGKTIEAQFKLWILAGKLKVQHLVKIIDKIWTDILVDDPREMNGEFICQLYENSKDFIIAHLEKEALTRILKYPRYLMQDIKNYRMLTEESLIDILKRDEFEALNELQVFDIALSWGESKCNEHGAVLNLENLLAVLNGILPCVRFTHLTMAEFMINVFPRNLLTPVQMGEILPILWSKENETNNHLPIEPARKYWVPFDNLPNEMFNKILDYMTKPELVSCRKISKRFLHFVDSRCPLQIDLNERRLKSIMRLPSKSHSFQQIIFTTTNFTEEEKCRLLNFVRSSTQQSDMTLSLTISVLPSYTNLFWFLQLSLPPGLRTSVIVKQCSNTLSIYNVRNEPRYDSLVSINLHKLVTYLDRQCLAELVERSPNLEEIILGNMSLSPSAAHKELTLAAEFLMSANLSNIKISLAFLNPADLPDTRLTELKQRGVIFQNVQLKRNTTLQFLPFLNVFREHLETIVTKVRHGPMPISFILPALKNFHITSNPTWLFRCLEWTPNLSVMNWTHELPPQYELAENFNLVMVKMTKLTVNIVEDYSVQIISQLLSFCPNLKQLKCTNNNAVDVKLVSLFKYLHKLEEFNLTSPLSFDDATGFPEEHNFLDVENSAERPYIGQLTNLRILHFGPVPTPELDWRFKSLIFTHGIVHLRKLLEITLPPMKVQLAETILALLATEMKQLRKVVLQLWQDEGANGTLKTADVKMLRVAYADVFQVKCKIIKRSS